MVKRNRWILDATLDTVRMAKAFAKERRETEDEYIYKTVGRKVYVKIKPKSGLALEFEKLRKKHHLTHIQLVRAMLHGD